MRQIIKKILLRFDNIKMAFLSLSYKRDEKVVLFGAWFGEKFADNPRFLFQFLHENKDNLGLKHVVWVTRNQNVYKQLLSMGYEVYEMDSKESIYFHKTAGIHIVCNATSNGDVTNGDIRGEYSYRAKRVNLGHGAGLIKGVDMYSNDYIRAKSKHKVMYSLKEFLTKNCRFFRLFYSKRGGWGDCFYLCTSNAQIEETRKMYGLPDYLYINSTYPRVCPCIRLMAGEEKLINFMKKFQTVVLYLPTFRSDYCFKYEDVSEFMSDFLKADDILWIEKPHSMDLSNSTNSNLDLNILRLPSDFDINVIIPYITFLITDYSTVRTDAMFYNKPVLYYVPDYEEYKAAGRGIVVDIDKELCGPKLFSLSELKNAILFFKDDPEKAKLPNYNEIRDKYWQNNKSILNVWEDILHSLYK